MDIQTAVLPTPLSVKTAQMNLSQWFIGQILNATVTERKSTDAFMLKIGNQYIEAKTTPDKSLHVGEQLKLIVEKQGNPVVLKVLQQSSPKVIYEIKQQLLRESMPKQAGMEKLTNLLTQISSNARETIKIFPIPIEQQFKKLIEYLPTKTNLNNGTGLKTAIKNSGIFLEAKLLTNVISKKPELLLKASGQTGRQTPPDSLTQVNAQGIAKDLKTGLLQLSSVIAKYMQNTENAENIFIKQTQITNPEVENNAGMKTKNTTKAIELVLKANIESASKQIESSIARIELNQSKAIVTHDNQSPLWSIEIPVKDKHNIDLLELNIQADKESKEKNNEDQLWSSNLRINFENIGTVSAKLSVINKEVNATLWSENKILNVLINDNLPVLNKQIERCGLSTGKIICLKEAPAEQKTQLDEHNLINITI